MGSLELRWYLYYISGMNEPSHSVDTPRRVVLEHSCCVAENAPAPNNRVVVFNGVFLEPGPPVVPATDPYPTLKLYRDFVLGPGEI